MKYLSAEETEVSDISCTDFTDRAETKFSLLRLPSGKKKKKGGKKTQAYSWISHQRGNQPYAIL